MADRLTADDLARMRAEHVDDGGACPKCWIWDKKLDDARCADWPCTVARLLVHFAPGPVPHLAGISAGLFGPCVSEEFPSSSEFDQLVQEDMVDMKRQMRLALHPSPSAEDQSR